MVQTLFNAWHQGCLLSTSGASSADKLPELVFVAHVPKLEVYAKQLTVLEETNSSTE
jgi:hypothetical protein